MTGMDPKLCARYRLRIAAGVRQRDRHIGIPVPDQGRHFDGAEVETPRSGEHSKVVSDSLAAVAEGFHVAGEEGFAHVRLLEGTGVRVGELGRDEAEE